MLCLLHSDKRFCQGFVFCDVSLSYLLPCFDFWSYVRRKTAKAKSCLLQELLSLGNGAWGFPHVARTTTLTEVDFRQVVFLVFKFQ